MVEHETVEERRKWEGGYGYGIGESERVEEWRVRGWEGDVGGTKEEKNRSGGIA